MNKSSFEDSTMQVFGSESATKPSTQLQSVEEPHLPVAYHQGRFKPLEEANINIMTHGFQYGIGAFAGIRAYHNTEENQCFLFRLRDHFRRLKSACRILQFDVHESVEEMEAITLELARRNRYHGDTYFRPFVYSREHRLSPCTHSVQFDFALYAIPLKEYIDTSAGLKTMVSSWTRIDDDMIPTRAKASGAYINSALAKSEALQNGCDEAIFLNRDGSACEGSAENLFIVRDGDLITPPVSRNLLEGITRNTLISLARRELDIRVQERVVARSELYIAEEAFFSGTGAQVAWIREIDKRVVGDGRMGRVTGRLKDLYHEVVQGKKPEYHSWLTPVFLSSTPLKSGFAEGSSLSEV